MPRESTQASSSSARSLEGKPYYRPRRVRYCSTPKVGDIVALKIDAVASVAHLHHDVPTKAAAEMETKYCLALVTKRLDRPDVTKDALAFIVALIDAPPRSKGRIDRIDPMHFAVVRIRRRVQPRSQFPISACTTLSDSVMERTEAFWHVTERDRQSSNVDPLGHHVTRHPVAEKLAIPGELLDERPVVEFSYDWQENVGDLKGWMNEYDQILSTILNYRVGLAVLKNIKDPREQTYEMGLFMTALKSVHLADTINNVGVMIFEASHRHPPCIYVVVGCRWAVYEAQSDTDSPGDGRYSGRA